MVLSRLPENIACYPAYAKLNLGLHIVGRRADGYHELESIFTLIDWQDTLAMALRDDGQIILHTLIEGVSCEQDLTVRAARLLQQYSGCFHQGVDIWVDKQIPMGAGLGGGSSDAATVLMVLNRLWGCGLSFLELSKLGVQLGADVPFFLFGQSAFVRGIGEQLTAITLPEQWYLVVKPNVHIATASIFAHPDLVRNSERCVQADYEGFQPLRNDMQAVVLQEYPEVRAIYHVLKPYGEPLLTGSGSCLFLAFDQVAEAIDVQARLPENIVSRCVKGIASHPLK